VAPAAAERASRGSAGVELDGGVESIHGDDVVAAPSGEMRAHRWIGANCASSGIRHWGHQTTPIQRVAAGGSTWTPLEIVGTTLIAGAAGVGVTCATGMICDSDSARTAGAIVVAGIGVLIIAGAVAFGSCSGCWGTR
jgi:hypothetical protein